jgi:hypothetical protein
VVGVPAASSAALAALFVAGMLLAGLVAVALRRAWPASLEERAVAIALLALVVSVPYIVWRVVEDVRYTTSLDAYQRQSAGPIQAFLPGYLVERADTIVPPGDTYATFVGPSVPNAIARKAFPSLVLLSLFPRRSASRSDAQWIIAWGVPRAKLARLGAVQLVHSSLGPLPPVYAVAVPR